MNLWESYQQLPSLSRIAITLGTTLFLVGLVYWFNRIVKNHTIATRTASYISNLITQKSDGVFYIYIAYWRFIVVALFFMPLLYVLFNSVLNSYQDLPKDFWQHWDKESTLIMITLVAILLIITIMVELLIKGYKAIQLEIGNDYVRFRKSVPRGGLMLSNKYISLKYSEILQVDYLKTLLIGSVLLLKTATETHRISLLLSAEDKAACLRILDQAMINWQSNKHIKTNQIQTDGI